MVPQQYYILGGNIPWEEDETHEFKGHRTLSVEELDPRLEDSGKPSRGTISKALCGFLNAGKGGTIYMGVTNQGTIQGIHLTQDQKDHFEVALGDLLQRYTPPVPKECVSVAFIPVLDDEDQMESYRDPHPILSVKPKRGHLIRTWKYCWCDGSAKDMVSKLGILPPNYIIELNVKKPFLSINRYNTCHLKLPYQQLYTEETGTCYYRLFTSVISLTNREIDNVTRCQVRYYHQFLIDQILNFHKKIKELNGRSCNYSKKESKELLKCVQECDNTIIEDYLTTCDDCAVDNNPSLLQLMLSSLKDSSQSN